MLDKLNEMKENALDVNNHVEVIKEKGKTLGDKIKQMGMAGAAVILLGGLAQWLFPWWSIAIVAAYIGFWFNDTPAKSFTYGTIAVILLWSVYAAWQNSANGGIVSTVLSDVFGGKISGTQLIFSTGLVGGLVGGLATMTGTMLRNLFKKEAVA